MFKLQRNVKIKTLIDFKLNDLTIRVKLLINNNKTFSLLMNEIGGQLF